MQRPCLGARFTVDRPCSAAPARGCDKFHTVFLSDLSHDPCHPADGGACKRNKLGFCRIRFHRRFDGCEAQRGLDTLGVTFALLTAILAAIFHLMTRVLSKTETSHSLLFYTILISVPCSFLLALFTWEGYFPNLMDLSLIALLGLIIIAAHYLLTVAYKYAPASLVAPANWVHVVWAALLGWLFFDHLPDQWTILGMLVIVAAGVGIAIKTHRD